MLEIRNDKATVLFGDSLHDVGAWLAANPRKWSYDMSTGGGRGYEWDLGASWADCLRMASQGWSDGARRVHNILRALPPPTNTHAVLRHDVAGFMADVPRHLAGAPDCMISRGKRKAAKPLIHIVVNLTTSGCVNASHYANFGAALALAIDKLESSGRRVELDVTFANALRNTRAIVGWKVKQADEHSDLAAIAFALAHPAAYRRFGFGLWERTDASNQCAGYGSCSDLTQQDLKYMDAEGAFIVNGTEMQLSRCTTPQAAMEFAAQRINAAAGEQIVELDQ